MSTQQSNMTTPAPALDAIVERLRTREARIGIVGLGYAGLPLAMSFGEAGFEVTGLDLNEERVRAVNEKRSYLVDVPAARYEGLAKPLRATSDYSVVSELDALTICVPTPLSKTRSPDLTFVLAAAESVAANLRPGQLIVLQSTTTPGTTMDVLLPLFEAKGGKVGRDFFLGYAPERVDPGNKTYSIRTTPKLIAGATDACRELTDELYREVVDVTIKVSNPTVAETAKLHENTFRAVNIALANELAMMCSHLGISAWEVIDAAATKPFAFLPHYPGPGLGGDCIPVVPHFLAWRMREYGYSAQLIEAAYQINSQMPREVVSRVAEALNDVRKPLRDTRLLLLGMAYKANVHDTRESPSVAVMQEFLKRGADVEFCDPFVPELILDDAVHTSVPWEAGSVERADCVVMLTPHEVFLEKPLWERADLIVDTRNVVPAGPNVHQLW